MKAGLLVAIIINLFPIRFVLGHETLQIPTFIIGVLNHNKVSLLSSNSITIIEPQRKVIVKQFHIQSASYGPSANLAHLNDQYIIVYGEEASADLVDSEGKVILRYHSKIKASCPKYVLIPFVGNYFFIGWSFNNKLLFVVLNEKLNQISQFTSNERNGLKLFECLLLSDEENDAILVLVLCSYTSVRALFFQLYRVNKSLSFIPIENAIHIDFLALSQIKLLQMNSNQLISCFICGNTSFIYCSRLIFTPTTQQISIDSIEGSGSIKMMNDHQCLDRGTDSLSLRKISNSLFIVSCFSEEGISYQFSHIDLTTNGDAGCFEVKLKGINSALFNLIDSSKGIVQLFYIDDTKGKSFELNYPSCSSKIIHLSGIDEPIAIDLIAVYKGRVYMNDLSLRIVFTSIPQGIEMYYDEKPVLVGDNIVFAYPPNISATISNKDINEEDSYVLRYYLLVGNNDDSEDKNTLLGVISDQCTVDFKVKRPSFHAMRNKAFFNSKNNECPNGSVLLKEFDFNCFDNSLMIEHYYFNTTINQFDLCNDSCNSCQSNGDDLNHNCLQCLPGFAFKNNTTNCYNQTEPLPGHYLSPTEEMFYQCHYTCSSCETKGNESNHQCLKCTEGLFPILSEDELSSNCFDPLKEIIPHYYFEKEFSQYGKCSESCFTCYHSPIESDTNCIECNSNYIQDPYDSTNCFPSCAPFYWYMNQTKYYCTKELKCPSMLPILNTSSNQCLNTCPEGLYLSRNACLPECPDNATVDEVTFKCFETPSLEAIEEIERSITFLPRNQLLQGRGFVLLVYESSSENIEEMKAIALSESVSFIDFKECLHILKHVWNVPHSANLLISKLELKRENETTNQVEYMIFSQAGQRLELSICQELSITVNYALSKESDIFLNMAHRMWNTSGVDIFNLSDPFFVDYCLPFTSEDHTDVILSDRKQHYFKNVSFCEENCTYLSIDLSRKRVECICPVKSAVNEAIKSNAYSFEAFEEEDELTSSNYQVIICYQQVFDLNILKANIGNYIFLALIFIQLVIMLRFIFKSSESVLKQLMVKPPIAAPVLKTSKKNLNVISSGKVIVISSGKKKKKTTSESFKTASTNESTQKKFFITKAYNNFIFPSIDTETSALKVSSMNHQRWNAFGALVSANINTANRRQLQEIDYEYAELSYEKALNRDKRSVIKMYFDIIHSKHIILCLLNKNDVLFYKSIKFSVFVLSTATDFFFNAFFYSDEYIQLRYLSKGEESFWITVPKSIFSYLITALITLAMEYLTETKIPFNFQSRRFKERLYRKCNSYLRLLKVKLVIYFIIDWLLMLFFWYYVSAFCAVYQNSQVSWLTSTLLSFGISMVTPFFTCFGIGLMRFLALKCRRKWLFKISNIAWAII